MHFSFFTFFSDFDIFQVVMWMFSFSMIFSLIAIFHVLQWTFLNIPHFSVFFAIFHVKELLDNTDGNENYNEALAALLTVETDENGVTT